MQSFDFLVIGAGIAGASAAYELSAHGRVGLLEREHAPGYHSTGRSAAILTENYGNRVIRQLTIASRRFLSAPPPGFAEAPLLVPRGVLWVAQAGDDAGLAQTYEAARALVPAARLLDVAAARALCPVLRPECFAGAVLEPDAMDIDVDALHQGFLKGLRRRGGELLCSSEVEGLQRDAGAWTAATRDGRRFRAPVVVDAAGAWAEQVAGLAGAPPLGLTPFRRTALTFDPPPGVSIAGWPLVLEIHEHFYFKPEAGRLLASLADETAMPPCDVQPEELDIAITVDRIETVTELKITHLAHRWAGLRSFTPDRTPVVGAAPGLPGFYWLAGQGGYGIMTSPALARALAALVLGDPLPADLGLEPARLAPARFY